MATNYVELLDTMINDINRIVDEVYNDLTIGEYIASLSDDIAEEINENTDITMAVIKMVTDKYIQVGYEAYNNPVTVSFVERLAKKHGVKLREIVYKPYVTGDVNNPPASVYPVLVMDVPIKRLKQMVAMKSHTSLTNTKRDAKTGQVTGHDKTARVTEPEAYSLMVQECYACAQEAFGPMADDEAAYFEMQKRILRDGEVSLEDLPNDPLNKVTMNTLNAFILGSGIVSNLIDESGYLLPITLKSREDKSSTIKR